MRAAMMSAVRLGPRLSSTDFSTPADWRRRPQLDTWARRSTLSQFDLSAAKVIHAPDDLEGPRRYPLGEYRLRPFERIHALIDVRANGVVQEIAALGLGSLHRRRNGVHQYAHVPFR